jgi:hypothetical protein
MRIVLFLLVTSLSGLASAQQMNCDCTQIIGSCEASIRARPTGEAGAYGAELRITSTAPICSKVSYFIDSMNYFTILSRGNTGEDSVFGTKPFTADMLTEVRCQVCKSHVASAVSTQEAGSPGQASSAKVRLPEVLNGRWCNEDDSSKWNVWRVAGNRINTRHPESTGSFTFAITGENTFTVSNLFNEHYTLQDNDTLLMKNVFSSRTLKRCG